MPAPGYVERRYDHAADLLMRAVSIPSVTPRDEAPHAAAPGERDIADFVSEWAAGLGLQAEQHEAKPGRPNVVVTVRGAGTRPGLLLETHLDTVETVGMPQPFVPRIEDGRLIGRGAADAKGSLVGFMMLIEELVLGGTPPPVDVTLAAVADEEHGYRGVVALMERIEPSQFIGAIVGEPTELKLGIAHTGCVRATITVTGTAGHSSRPAEAINAITIAQPIVRAFDALQPASPEHPLLGSGVRTITRISGGEGPNVVPGAVELDFDRRLVPGEEPDAVLESIRREIEALVPSRVSMGAPFTVDFALDTAPSSPVVHAVRSGLRAAGADDVPVGLPFGSDASKIGRAGVDAVVCGPGSIADAHTVTESIDIAEIVQYVEVLHATVDALAGASHRLEEESP